MIKFSEWCKLHEKTFVNAAGKKVSYQTPPPPKRKKKRPPEPGPIKTRSRDSEYDPKALEAERKRFGSRNPFG